MQEGSRLTGTHASIGATPNTNGLTGGMSVSGPVGGTISGGVLNFTMSVPAGGIPAPYQTCSSSVTGVAANMTTSTMQGTYSGTLTCAGGTNLFGAGTFT